MSEQSRKQNHSKCWYIVLLEGMCMLAVKLKPLLIALDYESKTPSLFLEFPKSKWFTRLNNAIYALQQLLK